MRRSRCALGAATFLGVAVVALTASRAPAAGNVVMALDGMIVNNTGGGQANWDGFNRFTYGSITVGEPTTPGLGRYDAFTIAEPGTGGSGVGVNFALGTPAIDSPRDALGGPIIPVTSQMFPLLDRASFGVNFDPNQYVAELIYKPLAGNTATQLNMTLDTTDGFDDNGNRMGEQWQWGFFDLVNTYNTTQTNGDLDEHGFARSFSNMGVLSQAAANFDGPSFMFDRSLLTENDHLPDAQRDRSADFNDFEGGVLQVPNGAVQIHLQTVYGAPNEVLIDNWEIKALRIIKLTPDAREVARLDGSSGFSQRFGSPFERDPAFINIGGVNYDPPATDQVSRFNATGLTNIVLNTDDDASVGGLGLFQPAATQVFDGTTATMEIRARLTAPLAGQADHIVVVAKDKDGNGTDEVGDLGGEEYHFNIPLNSFNQVGMTTLSLPFSAAAILQAQEFATPGDGSPAEFNLYYLGLQTDPGAGLVDLEIEYIRVMLPGQAGDFDGDSDVDGNDFLTWQRGLGAQFDADDLTDWKNNFGAGGAATAAAGAVPEPASAALAIGVALCAAAGRRRWMLG